MGRSHRGPPTAAATAHSGSATPHAASAPRRPSQGSKTSPTPARNSKPWWAAVPAAPGAAPRGGGGGGGPPPPARSRGGGSHELPADAGVERRRLGEHLCRRG